MRLDRLYFKVLIKHIKSDENFEINMHHGYSYKNYVNYVYSSKYFCWAFMPSKSRLESTLNSLIKVKVVYTYTYLDQSDKLNETKTAVHNTATGWQTFITEVIKSKTWKKNILMWNGDIWDKRSVNMADLRHFQIW